MEFGEKCGLTDLTVSHVRELENTAHGGEQSAL